MCSRKSSFGVWSMLSAPYKSRWKTSLTIFFLMPENHAACSELSPLTHSKKSCRRVRCGRVSNYACTAKGTRVRHTFVAFSVDFENRVLDCWMSEDQTCWAVFWPRKPFSWFLSPEAML